MHLKVCRQHFTSLLIKLISPTIFLLRLSPARCASFKIVPPKFVESINQLLFLASPDSLRSVSILFSKTLYEKVSLLKFHSNVVHEPIKRENQTSGKNKYKKQGKFYLDYLNNGLYLLRGLFNYLEVLALPEVKMGYPVEMFQSHHDASQVRKRTIHQRI